jgi:hypothetical protein
MSADKEPQKRARLVTPSEDELSEDNGPLSTLFREIQLQSEGSND